MDYTTRSDVLRALQVHMSETLAAYNTQESSSIECHYDNVKGKVPSDLSTFLRFTINFSPLSENVTDLIQRQAGIAVIQVFTELGKGLNESAKISDFFEDAFHRTKWVNDVLEVTNTATSSVDPDGSYYIENVSIYFEFNKGKPYGPE